VIARFAATFGRRIARRADPSAVGGLWFLGLVVLLALLAPLSGYPVGADVDPAIRSQGPSLAHWFGTDHLGRDVFWRLVLASRTFVGPGLLSCGIAAVIGVPLGAIAGWTSGPSSLAIRTGIASIAAIPRLVLVLLGCAVYGDGPVALATIAGIGAAPSIAETVIERVERLRIEEFVLASRAHGLSDLRILGLHLVVMASGRGIVRRLFETFGAFVVIECTLSYLGGFGVQEPMPSWGNMLAFEWGRDLGSSVLAPGIAIWATLGACVLTSRMFGEVVDD
jgi:peptide/nickel transport system permease protein